MSATDFLIAGLGNPGQKYATTRHNAGFLALDYFARRQGWNITSSKYQGLYCRERFDGCQVVLVKPQTFMNRSGECVAGFSRFFKIPLQHILVVHDDLDLAPGRIKIVARGGAGGHNGIRSIISHLGSSEFARIKIGIGRPEVNDSGRGMPVERYVLAPFSPEEQRLFEERLDLVCQAIETFITDGVQVCMNRFNGRT
ncbi:aminoacyl-tRNA hydrolase [Desulfolithobacter sp.]